MIRSCLRKIDQQERKTAVQDLISPCGNTSSSKVETLLLKKQRFERLIGR